MILIRMERYNSQDQCLSEQWGPSENINELFHRLEAYVIGSNMGDEYKIQFADKLYSAADDLLNNGMDAKPYLISFVVEANELNDLYIVETVE